MWYVYYIIITILQQRNIFLIIYYIITGTSLLSYDLVVKGGYRNVLSIDNDSDCINYMREKYQDNFNLQWMVYDMVDKSNNSNILSDKSYDLIVDKGTLDAVLVEGLVSTMLYDIHRMLNVGGVYFICSLHSSTFLASLLEINELKLKVSYYECKSMKNQGNIIGTIAICKKINDQIVNIETLQKNEILNMDKHFQEDNPYLTSELQEQISNEFYNYYCQTNGNPIDKNEVAVPIEIAYKLMFSRNDQLHYSYELFLEDLNSFPLKKNDILFVKEAIEFMKIMQ